MGFGLVRAAERDRIIRGKGSRQLFAPAVDIDATAPGVPDMQLSDRLTRAEAAGSVRFVDLPPDHWAAAVAARSHRTGIVTGFEDGTFRPDARVTLEAAIGFLVRAFPPAAATRAVP